MAEKILWNDHWEFLEIPIAEGIEISVMPDDQEMPQEGFRGITLPHDWLIEDAKNLYRDSIGWYRKTFTVHPEADREYLIRFDGVYMDSAIYVNGKLVMEWKYGYSTFEADLTPYLVEGENRIVVRAVNQYLNTRWYSGAGIYRNVWWKERCRDHIVSDGIYITPRKVQDGLWKVEIDTELSLGAKEKTDRYILKQTILSPNGVIVAQDTAVVGDGAACEGGETSEDSGRFPEGQGVFTGKYAVSQEVEVRNPALWDIGQGRLYRLVTELYRGDTLLETEEQNFGFRTIEFIPDKGFFINGRYEKINGVCEHHDFGCLGAAFYKDAMRRKFHKLRAMGVNAVRTSHNMPAPEVMELADEMGFLVDSDAFDMWEKSKTPYDYGRFFKEWYAKDVASWIRRDRNHPSVIMWSIGNEIPDTVESAHGQEITAYLLKEVKKHDPKKHAPVTIASNYLKWDHAIACTELVELAGYNYSEYLYAKHHKEHPDWVIYGSETASVLASRGIYHFPKSRHILTEEDEQCSALGNSITGWGAVSYESCIIDDRDAPYSLGQFIWTGFDYIGESTPYQTKNSYFGQLDTAGFPKDSYYIFQAEWTDYKTAPMVHVFPYWDFNPGQMIDIQVCSNAPCVELFVNGKSMGRREIDHRHGRELVQCYQTAYEPGSIEAVAYDEE
ncbi:MAG: glycoside hydrolase family 2 protein, partial [Lachnospiraceae bacterium]|nr:glycoside hydrolase family 2 protein [Lachnospiraceae bacterium]